jgi:hypothetical protein
MQEKYIYVSNLGDDDLIAIKDSFYKVIKLKQGFDNLMKSIDSYLCLILGSYQGSNLGLIKYESNIHGDRYGLISQFTQSGFKYKFVKLGCSGWQTGLMQLSVNLYLSLDQDNIQENPLILNCDDLESLNFFDDEDIMSFTEDIFCKSKNIKEIFNQCFKDEKFYKYCSSSLFQNIQVLRGNDEIFIHGLPLQVLRTDLGRWDNMTLRIKFILEFKNDFDKAIQNISDISPLDEIRRTAEL